jgi:tetratricopeptide (TPR) repeat protein
VTAAILVLLAIVTGSIAASIGLVRAELALREADRLRNQAEQRRQEAEARRREADAARIVATAEATKATKVVGLLEDLLGAGHPDHGHSADYTVRQMLDDSAESMLASLADQPDVEATLRCTIGRGYWRLGDMSRARPHLEKAFELRRAELGPNHRLTITSEIDRAMYLVAISQFDEALKAVEHAFAVIGVDGATDEHISALFVLARLHDAHARYSEAENCTGDALRIARQLHGPRSPTTLWIQSFHVYSLIQLRNRPATESLARQTLALQTEVFGPNNAQVAFTLCLLGLVLHDRGELAEAERLVRQALDMHQKLLGPHSSQAARDLIGLAQIVRDLRRPKEAEQLAREAVEICEKVTVDREFMRVRAYRTLGILLRLRNREEAVTYLQKAIELERSLSLLNPILSDMLYREAAMLRELGKVSEAQKCYREGIAFYRSNAIADSDLEIHLHGLANTMRQAGQFEEAEPLLREAAETCQVNRIDRVILWLDWLETLVHLRRTNQAEDVARRMTEFSKERPSAVNRTAAKLAQASVMLAQQKVDAAESAIQSARDAIRNDRIARADLRINGAHAECLLQRQQFDEAERVLLELDRDSRNRNPFQADDSLFVALRLIQLYDAWGKSDKAAHWRQRMLGE